MTRTLRLCAELVGWAVLVAWALGSLGVGNFVLSYT